MVQGWNSNSSKVGKLHGFISHEQCFFFKKRKRLLSPCHAVLDGRSLQETSEETLWICVKTGICINYEGKSSPTERFPSEESAFMNINTAFDITGGRVHRQKYDPDAPEASCKHVQKDVFCLSSGNVTIVCLRSSAPNSHVIFFFIFILSQQAIEKKYYKPFNIV